MADGLHRDIGETYEDTMALLESLAGLARFTCWIYGHDYRSDVRTEGTICVRCGDEPGLFEQILAAVGLEGG